MIKIFVVSALIYFLNIFSSFSESYICEVKLSAGTYFDEGKKKWDSTSFNVLPETKQFSITKVTEKDYKDDTFKLYDMINKPHTAKMVKPQYKIKVIYKSVSNVFNVCVDGFNENGFLNCEGGLIFNKSNLRFESYNRGMYIHGCDLKNKDCSRASSKITTGSCSKL